MKKIKITLLVTLLFTSFVYSQSSTSTNVSDNNTQTLLSITGGPNGSSGSRSYGTP